MHENIKVNDDIIIFGKDEEAYDKSLRRLLYRLQEKGFTVNRKKCEFRQKQIIFFGYVFSTKDILPDPNKIDKFKIYRVLGI